MLSAMPSCPDGVAKTHGQKGVCHMSTATFVKGLTAGLALGAAAAMVFDPISDKQRRKLKRKTEGVFRSIGSVIDTAIDIKGGMF